MVKFLQILAHKIPTAGGRLWRGQTWIGWMSATIRDGSWSKFLKGRAGEDAGAAHDSTEKAAEEPGEQGLSCWCCQCHSVLLSARCFWNAGPRLHLCPLSEKKACCAPWAHIRSQAGGGGRLTVTEPGSRAGRGSQAAQKAGDSSCAAGLTNYTPCLLCCPVLPPQAPFPRRRHRYWTWGSLPSFYSGALPN